VPTLRKTKNLETRIYDVNGPKILFVLISTDFSGSPGRRGRTRRLGADVAGAYGTGVDGGLRGVRVDRRPELGGVSDRQAVPVPSVGVHVRRVHTGADHGPR